ncbi:glycoside hydrolase family 27 protein [Sphingomonas sp. IC-56]|uniref:glycoside hydrolase family 27 protein n=1 Tax=Sphingomonas sp. IC-56 TaxID=2898529 RepID=UPI001E510A2D|nr:glycoside hydrolase family 27 protein [Sphingomonas sp. IC-56]MCD2323067.1 glycoside hydrolase family 27 protein [Sphingomonas sp. IC-56]
MSVVVNRRELLSGSLAGAALAASIRPASAQAVQLAATPPMGWNSWNSFATTITEAQALETAAIQAAKLLPSGYEIFTIDIQWYEPEAKSYTYNAKPQPAMDGYGRLLPAPNRFPSAAGGKGFAPIAAKVHALGLRFGIHLMRGIPRLAVERNLPVLGTTARARDIADTGSICPWNPDMYGVDMGKPGAQAYYDSVFALYASWGVDFVKMDDMSRPYDAHAPEIEAAHLAIQHSGRPMLLSLSPGETPVARAGHVRRFAQMWRISDDFWDEWPLLEAQFTRLENWAQYAGPGGWPDADMLPLGRLALGERDTKFTPDEQQTLMTLWSIARSPLIMGGDLRHLDDATLALLTNPEVLAVNQRSSENRPLFLQDGLRVWTARREAGRYLALFNTSAKTQRFAVPLAALGLGPRVRVRDLWARRDLGVAEATILSTLTSHGSALYKLEI